MTPRRVALVAAVLAASFLTGWVLFVALPRWTTAARPVTPAAAGEAPEAAATPKIRARLYYLGKDGLRLEPVDTEVDFAEGTLGQARRLIDAQLRPAPEPLLSVIPAGTSLRGLYITRDGVAFVDLSAEVARGHHGGSLDEIFTVYSLVNTLTDNLPAVIAVQLLVEGREVDTLAGHVDVRRPLARDMRWTEPPGTDTPPETTGTPEAAAPAVQRP